MLFRLPRGEGARQSPQNEKDRFLSSRHAPLLQRGPGYAQMRSSLEYLHRNWNSRADGNQLHPAPGAIPLIAPGQGMVQVAVLDWDVDVDSRIDSAIEVQQ